MWSFGNDFAKNVVIFGVHNASLYHADNGKYNILLLVEGPNDGTNDSAGAAEKNIV